MNQCANFVLWCNTSEHTYNVAAGLMLVCSQPVKGDPMSPNQLICVVDDDHSMLRMLTRSMSAAGFDVASFGSAEALLNSGQISEASCVILDIDLPGISGLDLQHKFNKR